MYAYLFLNNISQLHVHKRNTRSLQLCKSSFNKIFHHFETVQNEENIWKKPHIHIGKSKVQKLFCLHRFSCGKGLEYSDKLFLVPHSDPSSETQGQIVGAKESLNGRKNIARRKVKNSEGPDQFQTVAAVLPSDWCQKTLCFSAQSEGRIVATGWGEGEFLVQGFLGVLFKALGIFVGLIFASIQSSLSLGIKSTRLGNRCVINTHHLRHLLRLPFLP